MKQTAVKWFIEQIINNNFVKASEQIEVINQAKEMEKQDIENAFNAGFNYANDKSGNIPNFEDFIKQFKDK